MGSLIDACEARLLELSERLCEGDLTEAQFKEKVAELKVQDSAGTWWRLSAESGNWMRLDGDRWVTGGKPANAVEPGESHPPRIGIDAGQSRRHPARLDIAEVVPPGAASETPRGIKSWLARALRYVLGGLLVAYGIGVPMLGWVGGRANGIVTRVSRSMDEDNRNSDVLAIHYDFTLSDGSSHSGVFPTITKSFGSAGVATGEAILVRHVPGVPLLNVPSWGTEPAIGHLVFAVAGFLIISPPRWLRSRYRKRETAVSR